MTDILVKKLYDDLGQRISDLEQSTDIFVGNVQNIQDRLSDLKVSIESTEKFNDTIQSVINNALVSANNAIDSVETAITVFGITIVIGGFILQHAIRKQTKVEVRDLVKTHLTEENVVEGCFEKFLTTPKAEEMLKKRSQEIESTSDSTKNKFARKVRKIPEGDNNG